MWGPFMLAWPVKLVIAGHMVQRHERHCVALVVFLKTEGRMTSLMLLGFAPLVTVDAGIVLITTSTLRNCPHVGLALSSNLEVVSKELCVLPPGLAARWPAPPAWLSLQVLLSCLDRAMGTLPEASSAAGSANAALVRKADR